MSPTEDDRPLVKLMADSNVTNEMKNTNAQDMLVSGMDLIERGILQPERKSLLRAAIGGEVGTILKKMI